MTDPVEQALTIAAAAKADVLWLRAKVAELEAVEISLRLQLRLARATRGVPPAPVIPHQRHPETSTWRGRVADEFRTQRGGD